MPDPFAIPTPYEVPIHQHKLFAELVDTLHKIVNAMPRCGCGRYYTDRHRPDPTCHLHSWFYDHEIQQIKNLLAEARIFQEKAPQ